MEQVTPVHDLYKAGLLCVKELPTTNTPLILLLILLLYYKTLNGIGLKYISDLPQSYEPTTPLRSSGTGLLTESKVHCTVAALQGLFSGFVIFYLILSSI